MNEIFSKIIEDCFIEGLNSFELSLIYGINHEELKAALEAYFSVTNLKVVQRNGLVEIVAEYPELRGL